eukprot:TRINITY_DN5316_c0_g1_i1.p1 TRINITY_DN5316_c0_g1~~TRINITY_DN5316_c0_g1_i1.p1  ORF type:complete len:770 (+),score=146.43 TRINITY_DN5316_c0_g1_i1:65-2374(+)
MFHVESDSESSQDDDQQLQEQISNQPLRHTTNISKDAEISENPSDHGSTLHSERKHEGVSNAPFAEFQSERATSHSVQETKDVYEDEEEDSYSLPNDEEREEAEDEWEDAFASEPTQERASSSRSVRTESQGDAVDEDEMWQSVWNSGGITFTVNDPQTQEEDPKKKKRKANTSTQTPEEKAREAYIRRMKHRTHLLCFLSHLSCMNKMADNEDLQATWLSLYHDKKSTSSRKSSLNVQLFQLVDWVACRVSFYLPGRDPGWEKKQDRINRLVNGPKIRQDEFIVTLAALFRVLGWETRIVMNFSPIPFKKTAPPSIYSERSPTGLQTSDHYDSHTPKDDNDAFFRKKRMRTELKKAVTEKKASSTPRDIWLEVYSTSEKRWIHFDPFLRQYDKANSVETARRTLTYVIGIEGGGYARDVTMRYASKWTKSSPFRDDPWWSDILMERNIGKPVDRISLAEETREMHAYAKSEALPTSIGAFKGHPLYALESQLNKNQVIYPRDTILGYCGKQPIFPRDSVQTLLSKEKWRRKGRIVMEEQQPIKKQTARHVTSYINATGDLELFGLWQTEPYIPPPVVEGKVPRNRFGNVEAYPEMPLPIGSVHIKLPGIAAIAKKLEIDSAPALTGWEVRRDRKYPVIEGVVVAQEFAEILMAAYDENRELVAQRAEFERKSRIYRTWRRLARKLLNRLEVREIFDRVQSDKPVVEMAPIEAEKQDIRKIKSDQKDNSHRTTTSKKHTHKFTDSLLDMQTNLWKRVCSCGLEIEVKKY